MKSKIWITPLIVASFLVSPMVWANFDGTHNVVCATVEARDCVLESECFAGEAKQVGAPAFFRLDYEKKIVTGPERSASIASMVKQENSLLLQGLDLGYAWSVGIDTSTGDFSASITNPEGSFVLFGHCTLDD